MAAVLACGPGAVLSHRSAACHLGLRDDNRATIDVASPNRKGRRVAGITVHSGATLLPTDVINVDGIPTTTLARTLLDLAEVLPARQLERAIDRAEVLRLLDMRAIEDVLRRANGRRGANRLRALLSEMQVGSTLTRSELEEPSCRSHAPPASRRTRRTPGSPSPTAAAPRPTSSGAAPASSSRSTDATSMPRRAHSSTTAVATSAWPCWGGGWCASPGAR
jgi:predicted transcriptional regulator of viral defense system